MPKKAIDNQSVISSLKGADRVRKRPAVIFGSDGLEGCEHSFFEILSNSIDESREGFGKIINVTFRLDRSITVEDFGRGVPLDWNEKEGRYNWELVYCELFAGGKYNNSASSVYEFSLGTNGLGACATQCASEFMDVTAYTGGTKYSIHFRKGEPVSKLEKEPCPPKKTGTVTTWKPDLEVFTDIAIPREYVREIMKRQAVVNDGLTLVLNWQEPDGSYLTEQFLYPNGIVDYIAEKVGVNYLTEIAQYSAEREGKDREDKKLSLIHI